MEKHVALPDIVLFVHEWSTARAQIPTIIYFKPVAELIIVSVVI